MDNPLRAMRVLVAYDGSADADVAVDLAAAMHWAPDTTIRVVGVVEPVITMAAPPVTPGAMVRLPEIEGQVEAFQRERLDAAVARLRSAGRNAEAVLLRGRAGTLLVDDAVESRADVVLIGSRGRGTFASLVLGSVSAEVVDHAPCPVIVARQRTMSRAVLAVDGSEAAMAAERVLSTWPVFESVPIRVVTVADAIQPWMMAMAPDADGIMAAETARAVEVARSEQAEMAEAAARRLREAGRTADASLAAGDPAREIIETANDAGADLIAIGTRGRTGLSRMLLGSIARNVLHGSTASVLVARTAAAQDVAAG